MGLNSRITILQRQPGQDALGQPTEVWTTVATVWGEIRHPSGVEALRADAQVSVVKASIKVRRQAGITSAMRAVYGTTTYDIQAVLPDEVERQNMFLVCQVVPT